MQGFRGHFQITGAGDQRIARLGAMFIQEPAIFHGIGGGKHPRASPVERGLIQHRGVNVSHFGWFCCTCAGPHRVGRHAHICPDSPVDRAHHGFAPSARFGIGIQVFIGRHIIDLSNRCRRGRA